MKHIKHVLVVFECREGYDTWETVDMFDVKYDMPLKEFVDNFFDIQVDYNDRCEIVSAHVVTQSYSPGYKDD
jgi:hypothetical protein